MRFSLIATAFIPVLFAAARDILVTVGADGQLAFNPTNVSAKTGDNIAFQFQGKNHSVTQSTFAIPCARQTVPTPGIDSGFQAVSTGATMLPQWSFTVENDTTPLWFFCAQTGHCQSGMVFSVNANPDSANSFAVYQANAKNSSSVAPGSPSITNNATSAASFTGANVADAVSNPGEASSATGVTTSAPASSGSPTPDAVSNAGDASSATGVTTSAPASSGSPTLSASATTSSNGTQTGEGFRLQRSASLPLLTAVGLASMLLL